MDPPGWIAPCRCSTGCHLSDQTVLLRHPPPRHRRLTLGPGRRHRSVRPPRLRRCRCRVSGPMHLLHHLQLQAQQAAPSRRTGRCWMRRQLPHQTHPERLTRPPLHSPLIDRLHQPPPLSLPLLPSSWLPLLQTARPGGLLWRPLLLPAWPCLPPEPTSCCCCPRLLLLLRMVEARRWRKQQRPASHHPQRPVAAPEPSPARAVQSLLRAASGDLKVQGAQYKGRSTGV